MTLSERIALHAAQAACLRCGARVTETRAYVRSCWCAQGPLLPHAGRCEPDHTETDHRAGPVLSPFTRRALAGQLPAKDRTAY
jgi:hypothetical protein